MSTRENIRLIARAPLDLYGLCLIVVGKVTCENATAR